MSRWSYSLTPQEEGLVARVGFERQLPMLGQPERNRNYSEGDIWEMWQHSIAAGAELAAARMLGHEDYLPDVNTFKTKLDIPNFEVRYSFTKKSDGPKYTLRFNPRVDDPEQIYILLVGGPEEKVRRNSADGYKTPPYRAIGWMKGGDCLDIRYLAVGRNYYQVAPIDLQDMDELPL
jgi:hypothetical protein